MLHQGQHSSFPSLHPPFLFRLRLMVSFLRARALPLWVKRPADSSDKSGKVRLMNVFPTPTPSSEHYAAERWCERENRRIVPCRCFLKGLPTPLRAFREGGSLCSRSHQAGLSTSTQSAQRRPKGLLVGNTKGYRRRLSFVEAADPDVACFCLRSGQCVGGPAWFSCLAREARCRGSSSKLSAESLSSLEAAASSAWALGLGSWS